MTFTKNMKHPVIFSNLKGLKSIIGCFFLIFLFFQANAKEKQKEFNYLKNGVSFSLPGTWKTISDESLPGKGYYYSAESTGKKASGLFTLVTINNMENPIKTLMVQMQNMKESDLYKDAGIEFTAIEKSHFGSTEANKILYESIVKGIKVSGTIYCFNCSEKTYMIFFQTGLSDMKNNLKAFELIELTFACR
jgi:hypothetical protein